MKKYCFLVLCLVISVFITSCAEVLPIETSTSTETPAENDEVSGSEIASDMSHEEIHEPPETLVFKNPDDLRGFIALADSSNEDIEQYKTNHPEAQLFVVKELSDISKKIKKSDIPKPEFFNADINEFGGTYYSSRNELDLVYIVDGIRYRFVYSYDKPEQSYNGNDIEKCTFANHEFDLYEGDGCFVGSIYADYATIRIVIYSNARSDARFFTENNLEDVIPENIRDSNADTAQESRNDDFTETSTSSETSAENNEVSEYKAASEISQEEPHEPPETLVFKNLDDLRVFIALADSSNEDIEQYKTDHPEAQLFVVKELSDISEKIKKSDIPKPEFFNADINEFGGTYYSSRNELDLVYIVGGIRYRFVYSYNKPEHSYSGNDVEKCTFANHEFDLYEGDGCFVGSIYADYATIRITIYSTDSSSIRQMIL